MILFATLPTTSGNPKLDLTFHWVEIFVDLGQMSKQEKWEKMVFVDSTLAWFGFHAVCPENQLADSDMCFIFFSQLPNGFKFLSEELGLDNTFFWMVLFSDVQIFCALMSSWLRAAEAAKCGRSCWLTRLSLLNFQLSKPIPQILNSPVKS